MKISLNWLKSYLDFDLSNEELKDLLTDIGLEVESIEPFESVKGGLRGLVIGHVLEKEKHADADKLSVCKVDVGAEVLQIVCGAPNVEPGQKVVVALVGTQVVPIEGEPFVIKKAKIRGVESCGMICAEDEIGLGSSHAGIMILDPAIEVGTLAADLFGIESDFVIEIGLTPNRTDAFSHIGVARDLAAALSFRNNTNYKLKVPDSKLVDDVNKKLDFIVEVQQKEACPRYTGLVIEGLKVGESPAWLKNRLKSIGQKSVNNIVDVTNFVLHEYGQPLHAFDLSEIKGSKIKVGNLPAGTKFTALDNTVIELNQEDLMICDGEGSGMCIAGVYGGLRSGVKDSTTTIFLESAYFDPKTIRRTSTRHGLRTEAATHFEKGIDPNGILNGLLRAAYLLETHFGGNISSQVFDIQTKSIDLFKVKLEYKNIQNLTGVVISPEDILRILNLLEIEVTATEGPAESLIWSLNVPPYRTDVTREADVIEDILRIYSFNRVQIPKRLSASLNFTNPFDADKLYNRTADSLVGLGFYEMMNNSIGKSKYQSALKGQTQEAWVRLLSSINTELDVLRNNMLFSGLESVAHNINHKNANVKLFEFGKTYNIDNQSIDVDYIKQYKEQNHLAIFVSGNKSSGNWKSPVVKTDFYYLKSIVDSILSRIGINDYLALDTETSELFQYSLVYRKGGQQGKVLVEYGKVQPHLAKLLDIKQDVYFADFKWDNIIHFTKKLNITSGEISKYPSIKRDLALLLDKKVKFSEVKSIGEQLGKKILRNIELFDIYEDEKIGKDNKSYAVSFTFTDATKTLQDAEIEQIMGNLMEAYKTTLNAIIR